MTTTYQDALIEITDQEIIFRRYYFPTGTDKRVPLADIEGIEIRQPSTFVGKYRIWGTGDLRTWYPYDRHRSSRDKIFRATVRGSRVRIGFTVERPDEVIQIFKARGLLINP